MLKRGLYKKTLKRLERTLKADMRKTARRGIPFNPYKSCTWHDFGGWDMLSSDNCGICVLASHCVIRQPLKSNSVPVAAARSLKISVDLSEAIFDGIMYSLEERNKIVAECEKPRWYVQAMDLCNRLVDYGNRLNGKNTLYTDS